VPFFTRTVAQERLDHPVRLEDNEVTRWRFFNAIPVRWEMGEFDSMGTAAQCEILERRRVDKKGK